jgi:hypothetical protein
VGQAGKAGGAAMWMQINHPGRQVQALMPGVVWAPSAVGVDLGKHTKRFGRPVAMTPKQIDATIQRFAVAAANAERAGFDGVEVQPRTATCFRNSCLRCRTSGPTVGWIIGKPGADAAGRRASRGHNSAIYMIESQVNYITAAIGYARAHQLGAVEPTLSAQRAFVAEVDELSAGSVWTAGGCNIWYLNDEGRNINLWPGSTFDYRRRTRVEPTQHLARRAPSPIPVVS